MNSFVPFFFLYFSDLSPPIPYRCRRSTLNDTYIVDRTPLDEWSARLRNLCLTTYNTHKTQISITPVGFKPTMLASERLQAHALQCAAMGPERSKPRPEILESQTVWLLVNEWMKEMWRKSVVAYFKAIYRYFYADLARRRGTSESTDATHYIVR